jgi:hypothetical protein
MVQGREFAWLRPNEVVTRPTSASGGRGLDYLWLRSRVVVKLSPEIQRRVARYSTPRRCFDVAGGCANHKTGTGFCTHAGAMN